MGGNLIYYAIVFLIVALVAAALGFGGVAGTAMSGAHLLIMVALVVIVIGFLASVLRRGIYFRSHSEHIAAKTSFAFWCVRFLSKWPSALVVHSKGETPSTQVVFRIDPLKLHLL